MAEDVKNEGNTYFDVTPLKLVLLAIFIFVLIGFVAIRSSSRPVTDQTKSQQTEALKTAARKAVVPTVTPSTGSDWTLNSK